MKRSRVDAQITQESHLGRRVQFPHHEVQLEAAATNTKSAVTNPKEADDIRCPCIVQAPAGESTVMDELDEIEMDMDLRIEEISHQQQSCSFLPSTATGTSPEMLDVNVGGKRFCIGMDSLKLEPASLLYRLAWVDHHWHQRSQQLHIPMNMTEKLPRDKDGRILIDRDPVIFRYIVNLLRRNERGTLSTRCSISSSSSSSFLPRELLETIQQDLSYFGLTAALKKIFPEQPCLHFSGAGVGENGRALRCSVTVGTLGGFQSRGVFTATFDIEKADAVGIGVISRAVTDFDVDFSTTSGCAMYYYTGTVFHNYHSSGGTGGTKKEETAFLIENHSTVTIEVNFEKRRMQWWKSGPGGSEEPQLIKIISFDVDELEVAVLLRRGAAVKVMKTLQVTE